MPVRTYDDEGQPKTVPVSLRMEADLYQQMADLARASRRSVNAEVAMACDAWLRKQLKTARPN